MRVHKHTHIFIYIYIDIDIDIYIHIHRHIHNHIRTDVCVRYVRTYAHIDAYMHAYSSPRPYVS